MCTVTWSHDDDGYHLLCNRDEKRTRGSASAPGCERIDDIRVIVPHDADAGGTWLAANEYGVSIALLNGANLDWNALARIEQVRLSRESRGALVLKLASSRSVREVCERLSRMPLVEYLPFTVVALEPGEPAAIAEWNGNERAIVLEGDRYLPICSSSYDAGGVQRSRRQEFERLTNGTPPSAELLCAFHESHPASANAYSPCMHRQDAQTVSFSWITVTPEEIRFFYAPGAPCEGRAGESTHLQRAA